MAGVVLLERWPHFRPYLSLLAFAWEPWRITQLLYLLTGKHAIFEVFRPIKL